ncbi:redoxin domain-containing protein [Halovenus sp. HT40]|uniref:redoxin domain-containing protein n=1 Tax=Halovenus sp. HT40 TaxID=3126691 RepID=UPI00300F405C
MISTQERAPDFCLPGTERRDLSKYQLDEYTNEGAVVLVFYPFDFSPVCTEVLCPFCDSEFLSFTENIDVFGISLDRCYAHQKFIHEYDLAFLLLSDTKGHVTEQCDLAYDEWEHHEGVPKRALVTIGDSNTIRYIWHTEDAYESPSLEELHETIQPLTAEN